MHLIKKRVLAVSRTLHVYLTMHGLFVMLLFGVTGFTINHEEWFGATTPVVRESSGQTAPELIAKGDALRIVEQLRSAFHIHGAMTDYDDAPDHLTIAFKEPGQMWEVEIAKPDGKTKVHAEAFNFTARLNNLHRGRYAGQAWSWVIDLSALFIVLACATGIVLWLALPRRRTLGIIALAVGIAVTLGMIYVLVPGPDAKQPAARQMAGAGRLCEDVCGRREEQPGHELPHRPGCPARSGPYVP